MTSHITAPGLLVLSHGPVTLAVGSEAEVTHWEFLGHLSAERLAVGELEAGLRRLGAHRVAPEEGVASVHIDDAANMGAAEETGPVTTAVPGLLLEALAVTWRARMQDISDASGTLNQAAVNDLADSASAASHCSMNFWHCAGRKEAAARTRSASSPH